MKVLFQNRADAYDHAGGDTTQMIKTRESLEAMGVKVDVSLDPEPDLCEYDLVHIFNMSNPRFAIRQIRNAERQQVPTLLSTIFWDRRHKYLDQDIVRFNEIRLVRMAGWFFGPLAAHSLNLLKSFVERPEQCLQLELMKGAELLLPNSIAEGEILAILFKSPWVRAKTVVVPNAVDCTVNSGIDNHNHVVGMPSDLPTEYVLEVGRIEPVKGQLKMIRALYSSPEIPLVFIGRPSNLGYFEECKKLGDERGNTWFLEQVPHEDLGSYYCRAKVHALPSLRESPGLVTLEAALHGANCVVSVHGPVVEYFGDDVWYCDPAEINSIRNALLEAWDTKPNTLLKKRVARDYTWQKAAEKTLAAYKRVLSKG